MDDRRREGRQTVIRKQAVDQRLVERAELVVEDRGPLDLVADRDAVRAANLPRQIDAHTGPCKIEARSALLFDRRVHERVGCSVEHPRLAEGPDQPVLDRDRALFGVVGQAREEVQRPVLAEDIAAASLKERPRREVELFGGDTAVGGSAQVPSSFR